MNSYTVPQLLQNIKTDGVNAMPWKGQPLVLFVILLLAAVLLSGCLNPRTLPRPEYDGPTLEDDKLAFLFLDFEGNIIPEKPRVNTDLLLDRIGVRTMGTDPAYGFIKYGTVQGRRLEPRYTHLSPGFGMDYPSSSASSASYSNGLEKYISILPGAHNLGFRLDYVSTTDGDCMVNGMPTRLEEIMIGNKGTGRYKVVGGKGLPICFSGVGFFSLKKVVINSCCIANSKPDSEFYFNFTFEPGKLYVLKAFEFHKLQAGQRPTRFLLKQYSLAQATGATLEEHSVFKFSKRITFEKDHIVRAYSGDYPAGAPVWDATSARSLDDRFTRDGSGAVTDAKTNLQWYFGPNEDYSWAEAEAWAKGLAVAGGGWRLPTREELASLAKTPDADGCHQDTFLFNYKINNWTSGRLCPFVRTSEVAKKWNHYGIWFGDGKEHIDDDNLSDYYRAFAVREAPMPAPASPTKSVKSKRS